MISCAFSSQKRAKYLYNKQKKLYRTLFCLNQENFKLKKNQQKNTPSKKKTLKLKGIKNYIKSVFHLLSIWNNNEYQYMTEYIVILCSHM